LKITLLSINEQGMSLFPLPVCNWPSSADEKQQTQRISVLMTDETNICARTWRSLLERICYLVLWI